MVVAVQIVDVSVGDWAMDLTISVWIAPLLVVGVLLVGVLRVLAGLSGGGSGWKPHVVSMSFIRGPAVEFVPDDEVVRIAHQAWAELASRKAGIVVEDDDVIVEVYDSWYALFGVMRQLAKEVPVSALRPSSDAMKLLDVLMSAMNEGLRPHLTEYQARFRSWWSCPDNESAAMSPQERQRTYPGYDDLLYDMREANKNLIELTEVLRKLAHERKRLPFHRRLTQLVHN